MLCAALPSQAWDRTRHDAIAYIAECNLTPRAKRNIARYLDHSIVYYASWMDKIPRYARISKRRACELCGCRHATGRHPAQGETNCVVELMRAVDRLKDYRNMSDSLVRLNLMYVIHIVVTCTVPRMSNTPVARAAARTSTAGRCPTMRCGTGVLDGPTAGVTASINSCWTPSPSARKPPWPRVRPANGCMKPPSRAG